ncbi:MAG: hypothetical protein JST45_14205 [Bacteroidetes bacterium]|nr:hypothetical protein [Bacteroidota bacterium]
MWPVMTLTLLLQLTDEEQLFAQQLQPVVVPQEQPAPAPATAPEDDCASWPEDCPASC